MRLTWLDPYLPDVALSRSPELRELPGLPGLGVTHVLCLQQDVELRWFGHTMEQRRLAVEDAGMTFLHEPIEDFAAPTLAQAERLVESLLSLAASERALVHCQAGLGRAGTIAACALLATTQGFDAPGAIAMIRYLRPGAIQSEAQERLIAAFAATYA